MNHSDDTTPATETDEARHHREAARHHLRFGCLALLVFVAMGFALEFLHAFRFGWYLGEETEPRRLMWTLAHAHGTLVAVIHIALGAAWPQLRPSPRLRRASQCLDLSLFALPGGFFLGGAFVIPPDPGLGIILVPVGGLLLFAGIALVARQT
ncbi:MAG: hypothetical protein ACI8TX_003981 [Hyphomicrobiaceae bacterium]|jgi:hypothetical protein